MCAHSNESDNHYQIRIKIIKFVFISTDVEFYGLGAGSCRQSKAYIATTDGLSGLVNDSLGPNFGVSE